MTQISNHRQTTMAGSSLKGEVTYLTASVPKESTAAKRGRELEVIIISAHTKTATYPDAPHTPFGIKNPSWVTDRARIVSWSVLRQVVPALQ